MTTTTPAIEAPAAQPAPLRLSEAIRLGSMLSRQGFGRLRQETKSGRRACALGAAGDAVGKPSTAEICAAFPILNTNARHPVFGHACILVNVVVDLNDRAGWSRERIADFIESVEKERA